MNGNRKDYGKSGGLHDQNHVRMTGTVHKFETVQTKTGMPMIRFALRCWKEWATVVAFKDLALTTMLRPGDRVEVTGHIHSTQWQAKDGTVRQGWQIVAKTIGPERPAERLPQGQRRDGNRRPRGSGYDLDGRQQRLPGAGSTWTKDRPGVMVYQGGPF